MYDSEYIAQKANNGNSVQCSFLLNCFPHKITEAAEWENHIIAKEMGWHVQQQKETST